MKGFDSARPIGGIIPKIQAAGCGFVARYYSRNPKKNLSAKEAQALSAAGIDIVTVWEAAGDNPIAFDAAHGARDAAGAIACALQVGQPQLSTIFFAVDFDASVAELAERITPYFLAVRHSLADQFLVGVYGSGLVCGTLKSQKLAEHTWLGGAMGWRGSRIWKDYDIIQGLPSDPYHFGFQIDPDTARVESYGQWRLPEKASL